MTIRSFNVSNADGGPLTTGPAGPLSYAEPDTAAQWAGYETRCPQGCDVVARVLFCNGTTGVVRFNGGFPMVVHNEDGSHDVQMPTGTATPVSWDV
jgi:hypothetical protein